MENLIEHSIKVAILSAKLAKYIGCEKDYYILCFRAGLLHDIGKLFINQTVLNKKEKLSDSEKDLINKHVKIGCKVLKLLEYDEALVNIISAHHIHNKENIFDKDEMRLIADIITLADMFVALTAKRVYRDWCMNAGEALDVIKSSEQGLTHNGLLEKLEVFLEELNYDINSIYVKGLEEFFE